MQPSQPKPDAERDSKSSQDGGAAGSARTPNADMQAEDTGTADSAGDAGGDDSATAATRAMKQTSKTAAESGGKR